MAEFVATRNTCFALVSAIEDDFRSLIAATAEATQLSEFLPSDVRDVAIRRRNSDLRMDAISLSVQDAELLPYIDFADISKVIESSLAPQLERERDWLRKAAKALLSLTPARNRVCHTRPLEPEDLPKTLDFAQSLVQANTPFQFPTVSNAIARLRSEPGFVLTIQIPTFWGMDSRRIHNNLPIPEFDDTGFLGRSSDRMQVLRLLKSHYPVVTIVGEGGIGKTALALRCLYDLLEDVSCPYDAIVWVSMKTAALTSTGVQELAGAITSTLGLLSEIANQLGAPRKSNQVESDLIEEIAEYLNLYRIVIAIDNLETLSNGTLRDLLYRVPASSKILLTSRIGVGEFEARYPLQGLDEKTSVILLRNYARLLSIAELSRLDEGNLKGYCRRLFHNPLLIKWFVASVGRGFDPVRLVQADVNQFSDALSFCFDNLFDRLGDPERTIINCLASARKPLSAAEFHYLCPELNSVDTEIALSALHNSSIVTRAKGSGEGFDYSLSESALKFLGSKAPPNPEFFKMVQSRMRELRLILTQEGIKKTRYEYDPYFVRSGASKDEMICATYLRRALDFLKRGEDSGARQSVTEAKRLVPGSSEAWRIAAIIEQAAGELYSAVENYVQAIGLDPTSKIARYSYGMFLLSDMEDLEGALEQLTVAEALDPGAPPVMTAKAMALSRLGRFEEAASIHELLLPSITERERRWRLTGADQAADCYRRWAHQEWERKEYESAKNRISRSLDILHESAKRSDVDAKLLQRLVKVINEAISKKELISQDFLEQIVSAAESISRLSRGASIPVNGETEWFLRNLDVSENIRMRFSILDRSTANRDVVKESTSLSDAGKIPSTPAIIRYGTVDTIFDREKYGFIREPSGERWFFHATHMESGADWIFLKIGSSVKFRVGQNAKGPCAVDILLDQSEMASTLAG